MIVDGYYGFILFIMMVLMMVFMVLFWEWDDDYSMVIIGIIPPFTKHQYENRGLNLFFLVGTFTN